MANGFDVRPQRKKKEESVFSKAVGTVGHVIDKAWLTPTANLAKDVGHAVVGLPMGLVQTVKDPRAAGANLIHQTWHTWSPLFKGDFEKFGKQVYDHPLAPILDVVSVLSLGIGTAAKASELAIGVEGAARLGAKTAKLKPGEFGPTSALQGQPLTGLEKVANLRRGGSIELKGHDLAERGIIAADKGDFNKILSRRPSRRLLQEGLIKLDNAGHLPNFYVKGRYGRHQLVDLSHRAAAAKVIHADAIHMANLAEKGVHPAQLGKEMGPDFYTSLELQVNATFKAAELLNSGGTNAVAARAATATHMVANLVRHNRAVTLERAQQLIGKGGDSSTHHLFIMDPAHANTDAVQLVRRSKGRHSRATIAWSNAKLRVEPKLERATALKRQREAEAQGLAKTTEDIAKLNEELRAISEKGVVIKGGARDGSNRLISNPTKKQLSRYETQRAYEIQGQIKVLDKQRERAYKAEQSLPGIERSIAKHENELEQHWRAVEEKKTAMDDAANRSTSDMFAKAAETHEGFLDWLENFGAKNTTRDHRKALRDGDGNYYIAPKHDAYNLGWEAAESHKFLNYMFHKPTQFWKDLTIKYTPRTITNNAIGNWMMYAADAGGPRGMIAVARAIQTHNPKLRGEDMLFRRSGIMQQLHSSDLADTFGAGNQINRAKTELSESFLKRGAQRAKREGVYGAVRALSETPVKEATIYHTYSRMIEVQAELKLLKKQGKTGRGALDEAIRRAVKKNPLLRDEASLASRRVAGDYVTMSGAEKAARDLVPFYLWNRHILKHTGNMFLDHPGRVNLGLRIGDYGVEATTEMLSGGIELPDFMKGAVPLAALGFGDRSGRMNFISTASLNPYATVSEILSSVDALALGHAKRRGEGVTLLNPLLTGVAESAFETSLLTGAPSPREGGLFVDTAKRLVSNLPYVKATGQLFSEDQFNTPKGNPLLYGRTKATTGLSMLGVPVKDVSLQRIKTLSEQINGKENRFQK